MISETVDDFLIGTPHQTQSDKFHAGLMEK